MTEVDPTNPSNPLDVDPVALETVERRKRIEREDRAFVVQLRTAILCGFETPPACSGISTGRAGANSPARTAKRRIKKGRSGTRAAFFISKPERPKPVGGCHCPRDAGLVPKGEIPHEHGR